MGWVLVDLAIMPVVNGVPRWSLQQLQEVLVQGEIILVDALVRYDELPLVGCPYPILTGCSLRVCLTSNTESVDCSTCSTSLLPTLTISCTISKRWVDVPIGTRSVQYTVSSQATGQEGPTPSIAVRPGMNKVCSKVCGWVYSGYPCF